MSKRKSSCNTIVLSAYLHQCTNRRCWESVLVD